MTYLTQIESTRAIIGKFKNMQVVNKCVFKNN